MSKVSRRQLARYAADQIVDGISLVELSRQLAAVLAVGRRGSEAELLADDIAWELENRGYFANAQITSARDLSSAARQKLVQSLRKSLGVANVKITEQVDPAVLGGVRVETAAHSWDETIARRLNELKGTA